MFGQHGYSVMPPRSDDSAAALRIAAQELVDSATAGPLHEVDVAFGARIVELVDNAQNQVDNHQHPDRVV